MKKNNVLVKGLAISVVIVMGAISASPVFAYSKDESVYIKTDNKGENYQTIVSNHLKNTDNTEVLKDASELLDIKNVNGEEEFSSEDNNVLVWKSNGNDIYYQGNTNKELPISCLIRYELDGKEMSSQDIVGKSGNVKIHIEFTNKDKKTVKVNGTNTTMYTPFVILTGTMIDNTKASDIKITNGKIVDNGKKTLVAGITSPGMQESLGIDSSDLEIPSKLEISFKTTEFEMENIMSYATPKILEDSDLENLDKLNEITNTVSTLNNSYNKLDEGINQVNENTAILADGASEVNTGVSKVNDGLSTLKTGISAGKNTATTALSKSAKDLSAGIDKIIEGKDTESETIKQRVIENGNQTLATGLKTGLTSAVSTGVSSTVNGTLSAVLNNPSLGLTPAQISAIETSMDANLNTTPIENAIKNGVDSAVASAITQEKAGIDTINNNPNGVKAGLETLKTQSSTSINSGIKSISSGFDQITDGVDTVKSGTTTLKTGTTKLADGSKALSNGTTVLASSSGLMKSGISEITNQVNTKVTDIQDRLDALKKLANEYNSFSGKEENTEGTVKFILISDSIKKDEEQNLPVENKEEKDTTLENQETVSE